MSRDHRLTATIRLFKPHYWLKNAVVFVPLIFSESLLDFSLLSKSVIAFVFFCSLSSGVYITNDIFDLDEDRRHPQKRNRSIAAGIISVRSAATIATLLLTFSLLGSLMLQPIFGIIAAAYIGIGLSYTLKLKGVVILDVLCIATGFVLRVAGGAAAIQVPVSNWLFICAGLIAVFLGFSKRRSELAHLGKEAASQRQVLSQYNLYYLDQMMMVTAAAILGVYMVYVLSAKVVGKFGNEFALTIPFLFYGIFRYQFLICHRANSREDPIENLLFDKPLLAACFLWAVSVVLIIYM